MTRLSIDLPDDVRTRLQDRAARAGHESVEEYVAALLMAEAEEPADEYGAPPHLTYRSDTELEALLLERVTDGSPGVDATPAFWKDLKRRAAERRRKGA
jgi:plasmid stability protein